MSKKGKLFGKGGILDNASKDLGKGVEQTTGLNVRIVVAEVKGDDNLLEKVKAEKQRKELNKLLKKKLN